MFDDDDEEDDIFGLYIVGSSDDDGICESEELGYDCTYPDCGCTNPIYYERDPKDRSRELPEMFTNARIEDGFHDDD